ncbi:structural protein [Curvibacter phage P26059A]|nr:structural protein [Curvibacter phage P26059A]
MAITKQNQTTAQSAQAVEKAVAPLDKPERFQLGSVGYSGLQLFNGVSNEEMKQELNFPRSVYTYKEMSYHSAINSCLSLYDNLISKVDWRVIPPKDATDEEKKQTEFINECLGDMDHSFRDFIKDALSSNIYGFSVHEKVFRKRTKANGSLYDDGKIALKKLALRHQESITKFIYDREGNEILGVEQNTSSVNSMRYASSAQKNRVVLPKSKFVHITVGRNRGDPFGKSPLRDVYLAWRYLTVIQEIEAAGVARDLQGLPVLEIPAQYMSADASPEQKAIYENFKNIIRNIQNNSQSGIILPSAHDPETRTKLFSLTLLNSDGKKSFDTGKVKEFYQNQIYTGLFGDVLVLGQGGVGSFALGQIKNSLTGSYVESMLDGLVETFNRDVIRQLYELNGFNPARACSLDYENLHTIDMETVSKFWQRVASTGMVEKDRAVLNAVRTAAGLDALPDDLPPQDDLLTDSTTRAGDGFATAGEGTSTSVTGADSSSLNQDNAA